MPRIAVIQDGTETVRQRFADVRRCYERCADELSDGRFVEFSAEVLSDERVGPLLETLDPDEWSCVVFASNALLSGEVEGAVLRSSKRLHEYLRAGGGLVVLHQQRDSLAPLLPPDLLPAQSERSSDRGAVTSGPARGADDDVLLRFPTPVEWECLRDIDADQVGELRDAGRAIELPSLFFKALDPATLPPALIPVVVSSAGELIICRTQDYVNARVVVATPPLDWQFDRPGQGDAARALLCNAIRFAALGRPQRLVWYRSEASDNELLLRWLSQDGGAAIHAAPPGGRIDEIDAWLLATVDAFVLPANRLKTVEARQETTRYLERGGALVAAATEREGSYTRVTAVIGRHEERALANQLFAELRAVDGWQTAKHAFELRNIVQALEFLLDDPVHRGNKAATHPRSLEEVRRDLRERLLDPEHREDLGSSIALVQCLAHVEPSGPPVPGEFIDWLEDEVRLRPFDVSLQIRAALAFSRKVRDERFLADASEQLAARADDTRSIAALARVLDAIALLDQGGLLGEDADSTGRLAALAAEWLLTSERLPDGGWLSVEATSDIALGLVALYTRLPDEAPAELQHALVDRIATAASALRLARRRYEPNPKGVSWLARLTHAVIVADRRLPIGLQRVATLDWPESGETTQAGRRTVQALLEDVGARNAQLEASVRELVDQRLAARIGRAVATSAPVTVLAVVLVFVVLEIGWDSIPGVLTNVAILLGVLLALLRGVFLLLEQRHLLAAPAVRVRDWIEQQGAPLLSQLSKVKRG